MDMNDLARLGAKTRLMELAAEMDSIFRAFPDLRKDGVGSRRGISADGRTGMAVGRDSQVGDGQTAGEAPIRTPFRTPQANGVAERFVRTVRTECLDWLLILNQHHLERFLTCSSTTTTMGDHTPASVPAFPKGRSARPHGGTGIESLMATES